MTNSTRLTDEQIKGLLCSAFEGGANYWYMIEKYDFPEGIVFEDFKKGGKFQDPDSYWHPAELVPLIAGCAVIITDMEDEEETEHRLDRAALDRGVTVMESRYNRHFRDVLDETDDATTGDVFLQCCLFGEVIFG